MMRDAQEQKMKYKQLQAFSNDDCRSNEITGGE